MRLLEDRRLLPLILALGWAGFYGSVAASNATDVLGALGVTVPWRSGNVAFVRSTLGLFGRPLGLAIAVVLLATLVQGLSTVLYLRAARRILGEAAEAIAALRAATAPGIALWFFFAVGIEVLLVFEKVDWSKFVVLIIATLASLVASESSLRSGRGNGA